MAVNQVDDVVVLHNGNAVDIFISEFLAAKVSVESCIRFLQQETRFFCGRCLKYPVKLYRARIYSARLAEAIELYPSVSHFVLDPSVFVPSLAMADVFARQNRKILLQVPVSRNVASIMENDGLGACRHHFYSDPAVRGLNSLLPQEISQWPKLRTWRRLVAEVPQMFLPGSAKILLITDGPSSSHLDCSYDGGNGLNSAFGRCWLNLRVTHEKLSRPFLLGNHDDYLQVRNALRDLLPVDSRFLVLLSGRADLFAQFGFSPNSFAPRLSFTRVTSIVDQLCANLVSLRMDLGVEIVYGGLGVCTEYPYSALMEQIHAVLWIRSARLRHRGIFFFDVASYPPWIDRRLVLKVDPTEATSHWQAVVNSNMANLTNLCVQGLFNPMPHRECYDWEHAYVKDMLVWRSE